MSYLPLEIPFWWTPCLFLNFSSHRALAGRSWYPSNFACLQDFSGIEGPNRGAFLPQIICIYSKTTSLMSSYWQSFIRKFTHIKCQYWPYLGMYWPRILWICISLNSDFIHKKILLFEVQLYINNATDHFK